MASLIDLPACGWQEVVSRRARRPAYPTCYPLLSRRGVVEDDVRPRQRRRPRGHTSREATAMAFIVAQEDKDRVLVDVDSDRKQVRFRAHADDMYSLSVPLSRDGPGRYVCGTVVEGYIKLLRARLGVDHRRSGGRRVLLRTFDDEPFWGFFGVEDPPSTGHLTEQELATAAAAAAEMYLQHDLVFIPVANAEHAYLLVLNFDKGEYQVLDGDVERDGGYYYELRLLLESLAEGMAAAGRADLYDWYIHRIERLPKQDDESSCYLFILLFMELWDGEKLKRSFTMDDVHAFRRRLPAELIFSKLNEIEEVKQEVELVDFFSKMSSRT